MIEELPFEFHFGAMQRRLERVIGSQVQGTVVVSIDVAVDGAEAVVHEGAVRLRVAPFGNKYGALLGSREVEKGLQFGGKAGARMRRGPLVPLQRRKILANSVDLEHSSGLRFYLLQGVAPIN